MTDSAVEKTRCWLENWVIQLNLCPFARYPYELNRVGVVTTEAPGSDDIFGFVLAELERLYTTPVKELETTLVVVENGLLSFDDYLDFLDLLERVLPETGLEGIIQIASFHPDYLFAGSDDHDPANYTNRSPYPMFHLIREASLEKALSDYPEPENIPQRNIRLLREMGVDAVKEALSICR